MAEISRVDCNIATLRDLLPIIRKSTQGHAVGSPANVKTLYLHSNRIKTLDRDVLSILSKLTILDVSSNFIDKIDALEGLSVLVDLNLSNNKIRRVEGLRSLQNLRRLNLSFNQIKTLEGMVELHGDHCSLQTLDIKGNEIEEVDQLAYIVGCPHLRELSVNTEGLSTRVNPMCKNVDYSRATVFSMLPQLVAVDGQDDAGNSRSPEDLLSDSPDISKYQSVFDESEFFSSVPIQCSAIPQHRTSRPISNTLPTTPSIDSALARFRAPRPSSTTESKTPDRVLDERLDRLESRLDDILKASRENLAPREPLVSAPPRPASPQKSSSHPMSSAQPSDRLTRLEIMLGQLLGRFEGPELQETVKPAVENKHVNPDRLESLESQMSTLVDFLAGKRNSNIPNPSKKVLHRSSHRDDESDVTDVDGGKLYEADLEVQNSILQDARTGKKAKGVPSVTVIKPLSNSKITPNLASSNAKLLSALEQEEKRLRGNELRNVAQLRVLNDNLKTQTHRADVAESKLTEHQKMVEDQQRELESVNAQAKKSGEEVVSLSSKIRDMDQLINDLTVRLATASENERKAAEAAVALSFLESQLKRKEMECELAKKSSCDAEVALSNIESKLHVSEAEKNRLSVRFVKEREQFKVKIAEVKRENEIYQTTIKQLQREVGGLKDQMASRDHAMQQNLQDLYSSHAHEVDAAVGSATHQLMDRHREETDMLSRSLVSTREAYAALEEEYRKGIKEEQAKVEQVQNILQDTNRKLNEQTLIITEASQKENEMTAMIRDLTSLVKEQKARIADLTEKNQLSFSVFEEQMRVLEAKLRSAQRTKSEMKQAHKESAASQSEHVARRLALDSAEAEKARLSSELANQAVLFQQEKARLETRIKQLEEEKSKIEKQFESDVQALRVKNKMLDDQNDTIRTLKQNLENKTREHHLLAGDVEKREERLEEQLAIEHQANRDMRRELDAQEKLVEQLQSLADEYRSERDALRKEYVEVTRRLKERNDSIQKIEEEVARVRGIFKAKEDKLIQEKENALRAKDNSIADLRLSYETQSSRLALLERERDGMAQSLMNLQHKLEEATVDKKQHESEMRVLLSEIDRQKHKMEARMAKLRVAVQED
ncbi:hypothetical protein SmJEL517_g01579 [Synchytrium microbalum]|uniref:U2A'/phosphoprotein 32 family A C-terminal domain-containing protein n=1 Tax=Synchytrium microbalum TaxID=1806994 RepID=A0A507CEL8_9FUNG|nr:uncharacterized protein SmJEL517_g01579 [Synchytrium microbalum]TPX36354.1 hypothetical protein SmJEL517_g01579 [Synchytrium microbalum]